MTTEGEPKFKFADRNKLTAEKATNELCRVMAADNRQLKKLSKKRAEQNVHVGRTLKTFCHSTDDVGLRVNVQTQTSWVRIFGKKP